MRILLHDGMCQDQEWNNYARQILVQFVQHFSNLYGQDMVVYNVHNLIHLANDAFLHGSLDKISAFPFENSLQKILRDVRKPSLALQQVIRRWHEEVKNRKQEFFTRPTGKPHVGKEHQGGTVPPFYKFDKQFKEASMNGFDIKLNCKDNCVSFSEEVGLVRNILISKTQIMVVYKSFECTES